MNFYMNLGNYYGSDLGRQLYLEIAMIEEDHVSHYGSLLDTRCTWLENLLLHEYVECYLYYSFYMDESCARTKSIWEMHLNQEIAHLHKAAELLKTEGVNAAVVNMHTIKPIDSDIILKMAEKCGAVVTAEEHSIIGGLGSAVAEVLAGKSGAKFDRVGIMDRFGQSGKPADLFREYGLTPENIAQKCRALLK